jgi:hypothetical protein
VESIIMMAFIIAAVAEVLKRPRLRQRGRELGKLVESPQRQDLLLCVIVQDVAHGRGAYVLPAAVNVSVAYAWWPVFRCPSMAGFGCPPRSCGGKSLNRLRNEVFQCCSVSLAHFAFQACSFNHSDISPL